MRFSSPSELLPTGSPERKIQEGNESPERRQEDKKVTLDLIAELRTREASGVGNKGDYYSNPSSGIGVKHLARPERLQPYENGMEEEARIQTLALVILQKARMEHQARIDAAEDPSRKAWLEKRMPASVPFVVGYVQDDAPDERGNIPEYIVMETVKGKTLSHLMFQKMADGLYQRDPTKYAVFKEASKWREDVLADTLIAHVEELRSYSRDEAAQVIYNTLHGSGLISEEIALQVGSAIRALNDAGLFHRDLHERNIMVSDDGTKAWIIDFGSAKFDPSYGKDRKTSRDDIYDVGGSLRLWDDQNMALSLPDLTINPRAPLKPNARRIKL